jgi:hypothetical protein
MVRRSLILAVALLLSGETGCLPRKPWIDDALTAGTPSDLPPLPTGPALRVLVFGDSGTGDEGQAEVSRAMADTHASDPPDLVLTVGDNFYPNGVESVDDPLWQEVFEEVYSGGFWNEVVFFPTLGNHDAAGNERAEFEYSDRSPRWTMPGNYYTFRRSLPSGDTVRFLALDTNLLDQAGAGARLQVEWVDSVLEASHDRWVLAYGHHPMATGGWHAPNQTVREYLSPRFQGRVPLFLSGHNHSLELLEVSTDLLQAVCGGGGGRGNSYRVDSTPRTLMAFSNGGWCFLRIWSDVMAIELYNRVGTLRFRHLITPPQAEGTRRH